jgi:hypothetical protein
MQVKQFSKPISAETLNESLAAKFGQRIDLERFTLEQLQDARNRIRTKLSQVETNESFDSVHQETYQKSKMMLDVLNAAISERNDVQMSEGRRLREGEEDRAELVMAAKDMVDRVTAWMEDTAEMQTETMLELADAIRDEMGLEASNTFTGTVKPSLDSLYSALEATREVLIQGVGQMTGEAEPAQTMGADDESPMEPVDDTDDADVDADIGIDAEDDFGADAAAAGGAEVGDRARRESIERTTEKRSYSAKQARAGRDIGQPGKQFGKIAKSAGEKYGSQEKGQRAAGAVLKKLRAKESIDPTRLAQVFSKKK